MSAPSERRYSTSARVSFASFARSALLPLVFVHRMARLSRAASESRVFFVRPKNWFRVSKAAAFSASTRLACRCWFCFASRSACSAS